MMVMGAVRTMMGGSSIATGGGTGGEVDEDVSVSVGVSVGVDEEEEEEEEEDYRGDDLGPEIARDAISQRAASGKTTHHTYLRVQRRWAKFWEEYKDDLHPMASPQR